MTAEIGFGIFILVMAAVLAWFAWKRLLIDTTNARLSRESAGWPTTPSELTSVRIDVQRSTSWDSNSNTNVETIRYYPRIDYSYTVGGEQYAGTRINFNNLDFGLGSEKKAKKIIGNHTVGSAVSIAYDPSDPRNSVLDRITSPRTVNISTIIYFLAALFLAAMGVIMFFVKT